MKYVHEPQENIKMIKKFVATELIQIFLCAYCYLYLIAKSIIHTENVIINADDLLCLQLHTLRQSPSYVLWCAAKFGKIWSACRQHELSTQNKGRLSLLL